MFGDFSLSTEPHPDGVQPPQPQSDALAKGAAATMHPKQPLAFLVGAIAMAFVPSFVSRAADQSASAPLPESGVITGSVSNPATQNLLEGARVDANLFNEPQTLYSGFPDRIQDVMYTFVTVTAGVSGRF